MSEQAKPQTVSQTNSKRGGSMFERQIAKLNELAQSKIKEVQVNEEDRINRVRIYKARNGQIKMKRIAPIGMSTCLFKNIASLDNLLQIQIDPKLFQITKECTVEETICNRLRVESGLKEINFEGRKYYMCGAANSLKEGVMYAATEGVRDVVHKYFKTAESAATYMGVLMSESYCFGEFKCSTVTVYEETTDNDGMGYIRESYAHNHNLHSQIQVRLIDTTQYSCAKGTLHLMKDNVFDMYFGKVKDIAINQTLIKSESKTFENIVVSVRAIAKFRKMKSSFQVLQFVDNEDGFKKLIPSIDEHLKEIFARFTDREKAVEYLKLRLIEEDGNVMADHKLGMLLLSDKAEIMNHPWLQNRISQLFVKEISELAYGGALQFYSGLAAFDPSIKPNTVRLANGSIYVNMSQLENVLRGDTDGDLLCASIDRERRKAVILRYPLIQSCSIMVCDIVGDIPQSLESSPLTVDILTNHVKRLQEIKSPETVKKRTALLQLIPVLLDGCQSGGIGSSTLALSAAQAAGRFDLVMGLGFYSECMVMQFKHSILNAPDIHPAKILKELGGSPAWFGIEHQKLDDFQAIDNAVGTVATCYNYVCQKVQEFRANLIVQKRPLTDFRGIIPLPSFTRKQFLKVYKLHKEYTRAIVSAFSDDKRDDERLNRIIKSLEISGANLNETEVALAWNIGHLENRGLSSFAIHININTLLKLLGCNLNIPHLRIVSTDNEVKESSVLQSHANLVLRRLFAA